MIRQRRPQAVRTLARQAAPAGLYASKYTRALGAAICGRLASGESLRSICRADPAMPTEKTVWNWARAHPRFAEMRAWALTEARRARAAARAEAERARLRRRSKTGRVAWNRGLTTWSPARAEAVLARLAGGEGLQAVCREAGMPCVATWYNWMRARPSLAAAYKSAKEAGFLSLLTEAAEESPWLGTLAASRREREARDKAALRRCGQLAPRGFVVAVYGPPQPDDENIWGDCP
jgi:hypothetical protein